MNCAFERSPDEVTQQHISFRYNSIKQKLAHTQAKLFELNNLVKTKNPSLLLQLQQSNGATGGSSSSGSRDKHSGHGHGNGHGHGHGHGHVSALDLSTISHISHDSRRR